MDAIDFRPFELKYLDTCVELFSSNLDGYFSPEEISDFRQFLQSLSHHDHYYLGFLDNQLVACGGWDKQDKGYFLRWGIVDSSKHKNGLGGQLLQYRIDKLIECYGDVDIFIKTSGKAHGFFLKFGFEVSEVITDGIFPGIDEYQMIRPKAR